MYESILVLLDCSPVDDAILRHIRELAKIHSSKVCLFHVVHAHTLDQRRFMLTKAQKCLEDGAEFLRRAGIDVILSMAEGEPVPEVLRKIEESDCDLVAMATHGHKGIADFVLGSVSNAVKHRVKKPILLIRG